MIEMDGRTEGPYIGIRLEGHSYPKGSFKPEGSKELEEHLQPKG